VPYPAHITRLRRKKLAIWKRFKEFHTDSLRSQYRDISSRYRYATFKAVQQYEESILDSNNLGKFFKYSNSKLSATSNVGPLRQTDGSITADPVVKSGLLSNHFNTLFTHDNDIIPSYNVTTPQSVISNIIFSPTLVHRIITKLNISTSCGPDNIPPVFFKKMCIIIGPSSCSYFSNIF
jgi:hypothetical protein